MCFVQKETGDIINDSDAIANEAKYFFYENVYASRENEIVDLDVGNLINIQSLSPEQSNNLEVLISKQGAL